MAKRTAVGFIETHGLVGAIEAADAAAKAADVQLGPIQRVGDGLVSVRFWGDVAAVQAAVLAGAEAARRVGTVISQHLIPAPDGQVDAALGLTSAGPAAAVGEQPGSSGQAGPGARAARGSALAAARASAPAAGAGGPEELEALPVARLRQLLRREPEARLKGRQISRADKSALLAELRRLRGR